MKGGDLVQQARVCMGCQYLDKLGGTSSYRIIVLVVRLERRRRLMISNRERILYVLLAAALAIILVTQLIQGMYKIATVKFTKVERSIIIIILR